MAIKNSNIELFSNSYSIDKNIRLVKSRKKEKALEESKQIPYGGIVIVVSYGSVRYIKITDGMKTFLQIAKDGEGSGTAVSWDDIAGKPSVIGAGATQVAARSAIGAGTSSLVIGTTATTAMAGNTVIPAAPTWANISGKPAFVAEGATAAAARTALGLGSAATQATAAFATAAQGALAATAVQPAQLPALIRPSNNVSAAVSLNLSTDSVYTFTGTDASAWVLPVISGNSASRITVIHRGTGALTVQGNAADTNAIDESAVDVASVVMNNSDISIFYNNSQKWVII